MVAVSAWPSLADTEAMSAPLVIASVEEWAKLKPLDRDIVYYIANVGQCTMKQLEESTGRSRQTLVTHMKKLLKANGGPVEEHSSAPNDPRKYYTIE